MTETITIRPYVGIRPFEETDNQFFFGRERDVESLVNRIYASQCVVVFAPSGAGKTSLLRAGIVPNLRSDAKLQILYFNDWKERPLLRIQKALETLVEGCTGRAGLLANLEDFFTRSTRKPVLILDQFEEVGRYSVDLSPFWDELAPVANSLSGPAKMIISIREDYLGDLDSLMTRVPGLMDSRFRVHPLSLQAFRVAISGPLSKISPPFSAERQLLDEIVSDLDRRRQESGPEGRIEPGYLQLVCSRLWDIEKDNEQRCLRLQTYLEQGRARKIVEGYIRGIIDGQLHQLDQQIFFALSRYMVLPKGKKVTIGIDDLVRLVRREDFTWEGWQMLANQLSQLTSKEYPLNSPRLRKRVERILDTLTNRDSLVLRRKMFGRIPEYELCHDVLGAILLEWREWMKAASEATMRLKFQERVKAEAGKLKEYQAQKRMGRVMAVGAFVYAAILAGLAFRSSLPLRSTSVVVAVLISMGIASFLYPVRFGQVLTRQVEAQARLLKRLSFIPVRIYRALQRRRS